MPKILSADIGATNSRFAHLEGDDAGGLSLKNSVWLKTMEAESFAQLLGQAAGSELGLAPQEADLACFAVPGPVLGGTYCQPPWIDWDIDLERDRPAHGLGPSLLINDFVAQAWACGTPAVARARTVLAGQPEPGGVVGVIGAGSNLGHAALLPNGGGVVLASEFGHAPFPFAGGPERGFRDFLSQQTGMDQPSNDVTVSGKGLSQVHHFLTSRKLEPEQVGGTVDPDSETVRWMARFYGRACRQWALAALTLGGLYIAGGLAAKLPMLAEHPEFAREFRLAESMAQVLERIPVYLNLNEQSGLWGAAAAALHWQG
ncbi:MAG: glucokinase [Desulfarculaceae bacterium]|nr:glucokinase [Desulfarculaceae bacterium]MCF8072864.1 glucokinase [Desulfarculaceae bacterium]MCF8101032.1 glucokinase [Desulfarculaceae bacterium]MCF8115581.1 glucokinase [Desulfarculaceae bacterium]